jgi:hypothetical protein
MALHGEGGIPDDADPAMNDGIFGLNVSYDDSGKGLPPIVVTDAQIAYEKDGYRPHDRPGSVEPIHLGRLLRQANIGKLGASSDGTHTKL